MHFNRSKKVLCLLMAVLMLSMTGCTVIDQVKDFIGLGKDDPVEVIPKPQVTVEYGTAEPVTLDLQEGVPTSYLKPANFSKDENGRFSYVTEDGREVLTGIDVSEHQRYPDWDKIAADGIDFAMIRLGYRGSTEGMLYKDPIFRYNMTKATNAGLKVGVYFFSQATCRAEAVAEAYYVAAVLEEYKDRITMPVVFDWEETGNENARTKDLSGETVTDCAMYFTDVIREAGYEPAVYFNRHMGYYLYNLAQLPNVTFWFAGEGNYSDFYYEHSLWQYTFTGKVNGINGDVDINLYVAPPADEIPDNTEAIFDENGTVDGELYSPSGD